MNLLAASVLLISGAACVSDLRTRRIPNVITFGGALAALLFHAWQQGFAGVESAVMGWAVAAGFFFVPFALGGLGAGDVKLLAALGAWFGPEGAILLGLYTAAAGGVLALVVALFRGYLRTALNNVYLLLAHWCVAGFSPHDQISLAGSTGPRLAYGVAILSGTVVTLWLR